MICEEATDKMTSVAFVCVENAGRSQMASAFAEWEIGRRGLDVEVTSGGTEPPDRVHETVVKAMREKGFDLINRTPRRITKKELKSCDYIITSGCSEGTVCPSAWSGQSRDWALSDPSGATLDETRRIRDGILKKVKKLLDEIEENTG